MKKKPPKPVKTYSSIDIHMGDVKEGILIEELEEVLRKRKEDSKAKQKAKIEKQMAKLQKQLKGIK